jgi:hypothetical protein
MGSHLNFPLLSKVKVKCHNPYAGLKNKKLNNRYRFLIVLYRKQLLFTFKPIIIKER